jgi:hypothetical protein
MLAYWSHFAPMDEVEEATSVEDYARLLAADCIEGNPDSTEPLAA